MKSAPQPFEGRGAKNRGREKENSEPLPEVVLEKSFKQMGVIPHGVDAKRFTKGIMEKIKRRPETQRALKTIEKYPRVGGVLAAGAMLALFSLLAEVFMNNKAEKAPSSGGSVSSIDESNIEFGPFEETIGDAITKIGQETARQVAPISGGVRTERKGGKAPLAWVPPDTSRGEKGGRVYGNWR